MDNRTEKIKENATSILFLWNDYNNLTSNVMNSADSGWHKRMVDIYNDEAPKTLTKLILELDLTNMSYLEYREFNDGEVEILSIIRSINENSKLWDDAFALNGEKERVKFLIDQSNSQVAELHRSMINIKGE